MIDCAFAVDKAGLFRAFRLFGHSGAEISGRDLVCAAASTVGQTTIAGLIELLNLLPRFQIDEELGLIEVELADELYEGLSQRTKEDASLLIANCLLGVKLLAESEAERIQWREISYDEFQQIVQ